MIVPRKLFLNFLCNFEGKAYFLNSSGNVQLGNLASGQDYSIKDGPKGLMEQELSWAVNQKYYKLDRSYSPDLTFVGDSATIIRKLLYEGKGTEQSIYFVATKWNPRTGVYGLYYQGELDLSQINEDDPLTGITVKTMEGGLVKLVKSFESTVYEIPCDGSIPENKSVRINGLMFKDTFTFQCLPTRINTSGTVIPLVFTYEEGLSTGISKRDQVYKEFDYQDNTSVTDMLKSGGYLFNSVASILTANTQGGLTISGRISFGGSMTYGRLVAYFTDGTTPVSLIAYTGISAQTIEFSQEIDAPAGVGVYVCLEATGLNNFEIIEGNVYFSFNSQMKDTFCYVIKPSDLLRLLMNKIYAANSEPGHNINYPIISSLLDNYANLTMTSGMSLRGLSKAVIKISLSDFFDTYNPILFACLGIESNNGIDQLYFEDRSICFNSDTNVLDLGEVTKFKIIPANDLKFSDLKIGYKEEKYDNKLGNDEINTTAQYRTPYKSAHKELSLICASRADAAGIEETRNLTGSNNVKNNESDNARFIINIDFEAHDNIDVIIDSDLSQTLSDAIPYRDEPAFLDTSEAILPYVNKFATISGTSFKDNFALVQDTFVLPSNSISKIYDNAKIRFTNTQSGFTTISGNVLITGVTTGLIKVSQSLPHAVGTTTIRSGAMKLTFKLYKGVNVIATANYSGSIGDSFQVLIEFNTNLYFGDQLWVQPELTGITHDSDNKYWLMIDGVNTEVVPYGIVGKYTKYNFSFTQSDVFVYGVKRVTYDSIYAGDALNPDWLYNIEDLTPTRMMAKHGNWIRSVFYQVPNSDLQYQSTDKSHTLTTTKDGITFTEGSNIPIGALNPNILFYPYYFTFDTQVPITFIDLITAVRNAHIRFTYYGVEYFGFAHEVKVKPGLNEVQTWKLLASPKNEIKNLSKIDRSGLKLLNLPKMSAFISHLNPLQWYPCSTVEDSRYHFRHMDSDFFIRQVDFWAQKKDYYQKWQTNDTISCQFQTNSLGPAVIKMYSDKKVLIDTIIMDQITDSSVPSPRLLFQTDINLSLYDEGVYYFVAEIGVGSAKVSFISEGIYLKADHPKTLLYQYKHSENLLNTIFSSGFYPSFRVEGWFGEYTGKTHLSQFEDQMGDSKVLNSIPYSTMKMHIGCEYGLPPYATRLVNMIMGLDDVLIDGVGFTRAAEDAEWEDTRVPGWPLEYHTLEVRYTENMHGVSAITEGSIEDELVVTYNVNLKGFGEKNGNENIVPINKVE